MMQPTSGQALNDRDRLHDLKMTGLMDSKMEEAFDRFTLLCINMFRVPASIISVVDEHRQFFKSQFGLPEPYATIRQTPLSHSFCQHVVTTGGPLVVEDARENPLVKDNGSVNDLSVLAYLGTPIVSARASVLGALCVVNSSPRAWLREEIEAMSHLALAVGLEIEIQSYRNGQTREGFDVAGKIKKQDELLRFSIQALEKVRHQKEGQLGGCSKRPCTILLGDDHQCIRQSLSMILKGSYPDANFLEASTAAEVDKVFVEGPPNLAIIDYYLQDGPTDQLLQELRTRWPEVPLILFTGSDDPGVFQRALSFGFSGLVHKSAEYGVVLEAVKRVFDREVYMCPMILQLLAKAAQEIRHLKKVLTEMEQKVLEQIIKGTPAKAWAENLGISMKTAYAHRHRLLEKLNVSDNVGITLYAIKCGLIPR